MTDYEKRVAARVSTRLISQRAVATGEHLQFSCRSKTFSEAVHRWISEDPIRGVAFWTNDVRLPLEWVADRRRYSTTGLARVILERATSRKVGAIRGPLWWTVRGKSLVELGEESSTS